MKHSFDKILLADAVALAALGVVTVYAASAYTAMVRFHDSVFFLRKELPLFGLGLLGMLLLANIDYIHLRWAVYPLLLVSLILMVLVLVQGVGVEAGGARRWLRFGGVRFQPAELAKLALVLYVAHSLPRKAERLHDFVYGLLPYVVVTGTFVRLMLLQPDLGTAVCLSATVFLLLFAAGAPQRFLGAGLLLSLPLAYFLIMTEPYRKERVLAFLDPWKDPTGAGFQIIQSFLALGSGGWTGVGLGEAKQPLLFLPEPHTDFIFAVIGEQFGFVGAVLVLGAFALYFFRGIRIALGSVDPFGRYLALGLTLTVSLQALVNCAVVVGLLPTKGLPLPLVSYGGSSMVTTLAGTGILLNVSKWTRPR